MGQFGQTNDLQEAIDQVANNKDTSNIPAIDNLQADNVNSGVAEADNVDAIQDQLGVPPMPEPFPAPEGAAPFSDILPPAQPPADDVVPGDVPPADIPPVTPPAPAEPHPANAPIDIVNPVNHQPAPEVDDMPIAEQPVEGQLIGEQPAPVEEPVAEEVATEPVATEPAVAEPVATTDDSQSAEQILSGAIDDGNSETAESDDNLEQVRENILKDLMPLMDKVQSSPEEKFDVYKDAMDTLHDKNIISDAYKTATQISDESKKAESLMSLMQELNKKQFRRATNQNIAPCRWCYI